MHGEYKELVAPLSWCRYAKFQRVLMSLSCVRVNGGKEKKGKKKIQVWKSFRCREMVFQVGSVSALP